ncbi:major facilitator transporter [Streptomyces zinciresistens K42]|uniref:Major facilitator transporter n=1 Tax=Streptomyces zinciresistens K42 TaxID=700597 RepID=G2GFZ9_9ACTN|nr:MFS transporter [Streptomyces zinciresistens]EGX57578.1 major facilitator transporter [Streptomyces zinciresistens K42]
MTQDPTVAAPPARAGIREWTALGVLALPALLISLDTTVLHLAVPHLSAGIDPSGLQLLWIVDIYSFLIAGLLIIAGALGDRVGRRRLLLAGAAGFGLASLLTAFSTSAEMLIVSRALLGIAGATLMPSSMSLIRNMFLDSRQRSVAFSVWIACFLVGGAIGPLVGGAMLERFWWGSVFLLSVPAMVLLLILGPVLLPEYRDPAPGRIDPVSVLLLLVSLLATVYGLKSTAGNGVAPLPVVLLVGGLTLAALFAVRQRRLTHPLLEPALFRVRTFTVSLGTMGLALFVMSGSQFFVAQYLQMVVGLSPLETGLASLPGSVGGVAGALLAPVGLRWMRSSQVMTAGLALAVIGFAVLTQVAADTGLVPVMVALGLLNFGVAPTIALGTDMMIESAPPEKAGAVSAISETCHELGLGMGIAILGSVGTAAYRAEVAGTLPAGLPAGVSSRVQDTIGAAVYEAGRLPGETGTAVLGAARAAFTQSLFLVSVICTVIALAVVVALAVLLRPARERGGKETTGAEPLPHEHEHDHAYEGHEGHEGEGGRGDALPAPGSLHPAAAPEDRSR